MTTKEMVALGALFVVMAGVTVAFSSPQMSQKQCAEVVEVVLENIKLRAKADALLKSREGTE